MKTKERIVKLFMFEPSGKNNDVYLLRWEHRKQEYKEDKPILDEMLAEGLIKVVEKTTKTITYQYFPPKQGGKRKGAGRTPKFNEETITFSCRVPLSKKQELTEYVNAKLLEWSQGSV
jgi:hypothetical protein